MSFTATIDGIAHDLQADSLRILWHASDRTTADFDVVSIDADYRPPLDAEVIIERDGARLFGGVINRPTERGLGGGARRHLLTSCSAVDWTAYTDRRIIPNGGFPAGTTLKATLIDFAAWLAPYGVTLDPAQVTGPTLPEINFPFTTVREALTGVARLTAAAGEPFVWEIDPYKVLRMVQPSTVPAPFDIVGNAPPEVIGDVTVEPSKDGYANRVYVVATPKSEDNRTETFTGDGVTTTFQLQYTVTTWVRGVVNCGGVDETLNNTGDAQPATWTYDPPTNTITRNPTTPEGFPAGPPGVGVVCWLAFNGTFSGYAMAEDPSALTNPWEKPVTATDVDVTDTLQAIADAALAEALRIPRAVTYRTPRPGLKVGQSQGIAVPARAIDERGLITELGLFDAGNRLWWDVTVLTGAQSNLHRGYRETVRNWSAPTPSGTGVSVGSGGPVSVGPAPPVWSFQFNRNGAFGGNAAFQVYEAAHSLHAGRDSSITASTFESCQVFGVDTHLADPTDPVLSNTILDEDFEGGTAWPPGFGGVWTAVVAGVGLDGTYGVASTHNDGWAVAGIAPVGRCGEIAVDSWVSYPDALAGGAPLFQCCDGVTGMFQLDIAVGADHTQVSVTGSGGPVLSAVGANPDPTGGWRRFRLRYRLSSRSETSPGVWAPNVDGYLAGDVNGVEVVRADPIVLVGGFSSPSSGDVAQPTHLRCWPIGVLDNLVYRTGDCEAALQGSLVAGVDTTVAATRAISFGLDDAIHLDTAPGTFTVHGDTVLDGDVTVLGTLTAPGVPGAPTDAAYVTLSADTELSAERVLTGSGRVSVTDGGAGGPVTLDIPNDGVTYAKIQNVTAASRLLGRGSASGSGDIEELTLGAGLTLTGTTLAASGGSATHYDSPLSDGDLVAAELIFAAGACVIVQVPV